MQTLWLTTLVCYAPARVLAGFDNAVPLLQGAKPGTTMPMMGLGTGGYGGPGDVGGEFWDDDVAQAAVTEWLKAGGHRIDTSLLYHTQRGVGKAIAASGVPRDQLFITTKSDDPTYGMIPAGYNLTVASLDTTLLQLGTEYVDLIMIHWPGPQPNNLHPPAPPPPCAQPPKTWANCRAETWNALEDILESGKARAIGVSNYMVRHLEEMKGYARIMPAVNQFELNPYWKPTDAVQWCNENKVVINSYAPLGTPDHMKYSPWKMPVLLVDNAVAQNVSSNYPGKSPAQVIIRWHLDQGFVTNPRTKDPAHMKENLDVFDFKLTPVDADKLDGLQPVVCGDPNRVL